MWAVREGCGLQFISWFTNRPMYQNTKPFFSTHVCHSYVLLNSISPLVVLGVLVALYEVSGDAIVLNAALLFSFMVYSSKPRKLHARTFLSHWC